MKILITLFIALSLSAEPLCLQEDKQKHFVGSMAKNSAHMKFEAVDIIPNGMSINEALVAIISAQRGGLLTDLRKAIREDHKGIIHIEVKMDIKDKVSFYTTNDNVNFKGVA